MSLSFITGCQKGSENRYTYRQAGIEKLENGDYEGAVDSFEQALKNSHGLVGKFELDVLKYRAEAEYRLKDYNAASHTYDVLIQADKENADYLYMRCMARAGDGDVKGALDDYTKSVVLDGKAKGREAALLSVGAAMEKEDKNEDAMTLYEQALADGVNGPWLFNRMGLCKMAEGAYDEALSYFGQGDPAALPELLYNQAVVYEYKGDFKKALELMNQYIASHGPDETAEREIEFLKTR